MSIKKFTWYVFTFRWLRDPFKKKDPPMTHYEMRRKKEFYEGQLNELLRLEQHFLDEGKLENASLVRKKVCAANIVQARRDIKRVRSLLFVVNTQINLKETNDYNVELIKLADRKSSGVPDSDTITEHHVEAEQLLEELQSDSELASTLSATMSDIGITQEELDIMKEFETLPEPELENESNESNDSDVALDYDYSHLRTRDKNSMTPESSI